MSETTIYSVAGLQEGIGALSSAHRELSSLLEQLKSELSTSLGNWDDNARNRYLEVQAEWDASALRQQEIVQEMPKLLSNIAEGYDATERKNTGIWS